MFHSQKNYIPIPFKLKIYALFNPFGTIPLGNLLKMEIFGSE